MIFILIFLWCTYWYILPAIAEYFTDKYPKSKFWYKVLSINEYHQFGGAFYKGQLAKAFGVVYIILLFTLGSAALAADSRMADCVSIIKTSEYEIENDYVFCDTPSSIINIIYHKDHEVCTDIAKYTLSLGYLFCNDVVTTVRNYDYEDLLKRTIEKCHCKS